MSVDKAKYETVASWVERTSLSLSTFYRLKREGLVQTKKAGRRTLVLVDGDRFLEGRWP